MPYDCPKNTVPASNPGFAALIFTCHQREELELRQTTGLILRLELIWLPPLVAVFCLSTRGGSPLEGDHVHRKTIKNSCAVTGLSLRQKWWR